MSAWRKFTKFNKNREYFKSEVTLLKEYNAKRTIFTEWFNAAMKRAPVSLFCNKIERADRHIQLRLCFQKILETAVYDQDLEVIEGNFSQELSQRKKAQVLNELKKNLVQGRKSHYLSQKCNKNILRNFFYTWLQERD